MTDREALQGLLAAIDSNDTEAIIAYVDPAFKGVVPPSMSAEPDAYDGRDGVRRYFDSFNEMIEHLTFRVLDVEEHGDWAIASLALTGKGRTSGVPFAATVFTALLMRHGRLMRMDGHPTLEDARQAVAEPFQR